MLHLSTLPFKSPMSPIIHEFPPLERMKTMVSEICIVCLDFSDHKEVGLCISSHLELFENRLCACELCTTFVEDRCSHLQLF